MGDDVALQMDRLLRQRNEETISMSHDQYMNAIRALTLKASAAEASEDAAMVVRTQKQLANALFRWSVLRSNPDA